MRLSDKTTLGLFERSFLHPYAPVTVNTVDNKMLVETEEKEDLHFVAKLRRRKNLLHLGLPIGTGLT